jgi:hypothetical protein
MSIITLVRYLKLNDAKYLPSNLEKEDRPSTRVVMESSR